MKKLLSLFLILAFTFSVAGCAKPEVDPTDDTGGDSLLDNNTLTFAINSFAYTSAPLVLDADQNGCYSPLSYYLALAMATQGATGETRAQLDALLATASISDFSVQDYMDLLTDLSRQETDNTLLLANSVWVSDRYTINENYQLLLQSGFNAEAFNIDFTLPDAGNQIERWIKDATEGYLSPTLDLDPDTAMALINTLYLNQAWRSTFEEDNTYQDNFFLANGDTVIGDFMQQTFYSSYYSGEGYNAITADLQGGTMYFVLPDESSSITDLSSDPAVLAAIINDAYEYTEIDFHLPKFAFENEFDLTETLEQLGAGRATSDNAEFDNLCEDDIALKISSIFQQTKIGVDENGVEAAAATEVIIAPTSAPPADEPVEFILNRPFLFFITAPTSSGNDVILFVGVVNNPAV